MNIPINYGGKRETANLTLSLALVCLAAMISGGCHKAESEPKATESAKNASPSEPVASQPSESRPIAVAPTENPSAAPEPVDPIRLQEQAVAALEAGKTGEALQLIRRVKRALPDDPQTTYVMARILAERNRFGEAIKMLDDLAESVPAARLPALGQTAEWMVYQGDWQEAEKRYRLLIDKVDDTALAESMLSQLLLRQGRRIEAAKLLRGLAAEGRIMESSLRSLLKLASPFAGDAKSQAFEPIGAMGHARAEISGGNLEEALQWLDQSGTGQAAEIALQGRVHAMQDDFAALEQWASQSFPESIEEAADYWFALGVLQAHQDQSREAVRCFCEAVRRDPTDQNAYRAMSESLAELDAQPESLAALRRAETLRRTHEIGSQMAADQQRELQTISELVDHLVELRRPLEALAWRAVQVYYGQQNHGLSQQAASQVMAEVNRRRMEVQSDQTASASDEFLVCGVDPEKL